jgi:mono/diheme cytochrome c family protein
MAALRLAAAAALLALPGLMAGCAPDDRATAPATPAVQAPPAPALVERGRVLAVLGNCAGCHSTADGAPYAGGAPLSTPFGLVYAGNLTPDDDTGLGRWTADDFWRALHQGQGRDGRALVPAFPYTSYTQVTREDSDALFAYLRSLPPVQRPQRAHELRFPYGSPWALAAWQWLFFEPADLQAEAAKRRSMQPEVARGAYLVNGLGHCAACHAPRNRFGAPDTESRGGEMPAQGWFAPSLHPVAGQPHAPEEIIALLRDGQTARNAVLGPMAVVVLQSTQHWPEADLRAVAAYLGTLAPEAAPAPAAPAPAATLDLGQRLYGDRCADCHGARGEGVPGVYPALAGNATVQQANIRNLVRVLRLGGFAPSTAAHPRPYGMPPQTLSDAQMAAVLSHVRQSWGNRAAAVSELDVLQAR